MAENFVGMRGPGDFSDDALVNSWAKTIFKLYPNGEVSLTGILEMTNKESINTWKHQWKTQQLRDQSADVTNVYIDPDMGTPYVYASHQATYGVAGKILHVKVDAEGASEFRVGHQVVLDDSDHPDVGVNAKVVQVTPNGDDSRVSIRLLEADDNSSSSSSYNLATVDLMRVIGSINPIGGPEVESIKSDPVDVYNYTQIFKSSLDIARTTIQTELRSRSAYEAAKEETLLYHMLEQEKALIWGIRSDGTGANGKTERTMMGLKQFITTYASANKAAYHIDTDHSGKTWVEDGLDWLTNWLENVFSLGTGDLVGEAFALCGASAATGLSKLATSNSLYTIDEQTKEYGVVVKRFNTPMGSLYYQVHPLFSRYASTRNSMIILPPKKIKKKVLQDTVFIADDRKNEKRSSGIDGIHEEYLTELTYEYNLVGPWGWADGIGLDSIV